jgi:hypothetical protein
MSASTLLRLSGFGLMLAVPAGIVGGLIHPRSESLPDLVGSSTTPSHLLFALAFALVVISLPGLFAAHSGRSGVLGLVGYVAMMLLSGFHLYLLLYEAGPVAAMSNDPEAERLFASGGIVQQGTLRTWGSPLGILAPISYGVALLRAGIRPRLPGWLVIAFVPAFFTASGLQAALPPEPRSALLDMGFTPIWLALSYGLLFVGLAIPGYQLWRTQRLEFDRLPRDPVTAPTSGAQASGSNSS